MKRLFLLLSMALIPCGAGADDDFGSGAEINYAKDIAPILNASCVMCHQSGQIGPMSLTSYAETRPWAKSIKKVVAEGSMPPWHADPAYGEFSNDPRLSEEQIKKIVAWVDRGAPAGNLDEQPTLAFKEGWRIGEPDAVFVMKDKYWVSDEAEDEYHNFVVPAAFEKETTLKAIEIRPGNAALVHHVLVFLLPEGHTGESLFSGKSRADIKYIYGWAPGGSPSEYGEDFGMVIPPNRNFLFQVHYHKVPGPGTGGFDQSMIAVKIGREPAKRPVTIAWIMDPTLEIPPGEPNYRSASVFAFTDDGNILGFHPHMHLRGKDFKFEAFYPDGTSEILLSVPRYDFNWQLMYEFKEAKFVPKGTRILATAHFDNSSANPNNPDPSRKLYFREETTDEMMIGFMQYSYINRPHLQGKYGMPEGMTLTDMFSWINKARKEMERKQAEADQRLAANEAPREK